jgi:hypothetical protein
MQGQQNGALQNLKDPNRKLNEVEGYLVLNNTMVVILFAAVVFSVKLTIVWAYSFSGTKHVFVAEVSQMWNLLIGTSVFFFVHLYMIVANESIYRHAQNMIAYFSFVTGAMLYALIVFVDCSDKSPIVCTYLFPVSTLPAVEAGIGFGLLFVHFMSTLWGVLSIPFVKNYVYVAFSYGGLFYASSITNVILFSQMYASLSSCPADTFLSKHIEIEFALIFTCVACVGVLAYAMPSLLAGRNPKSAISWDDLTDDDSPSGSKKTLAFFSVSLAVATATSIVGTTFAMHYELLELPAAIVSYVFIGLGAISPALRWWFIRPTQRARVPVRNDPGAPADDNLNFNSDPSQLQPGQYFTQPAQSSAHWAPASLGARYFNMGVDNRKPPHLHKHV